VIVVDVETTGLNPWKTSIVSIGAVDFADPTRQFSGECRVWDGAMVEAGALAVNGYTAAQVTDPDKQSLDELMKQFIAWESEAHDRTIAGQNPSFDQGFLRAAAKMSNLAWRPSGRLIDLHSLAFAALLRADRPLPTDASGRSSLNTDRIMELVGIPTEPKPHIAINGALWEAEAFGRFIYGRNVLPQFAEYPLPDFLHPVA
jgi:DNA polymerase-3 subunit epsilon